MNYKTVVYGKNRERRNYSRVKKNVELPNLIKVQTESFEWFRTEGLKELFKEISPIKDNSEKLELSFDQFEFEEPQISISEAIRKGEDYASPLKANLSVIVHSTGEVKESTGVFLGDFPKMTPWGTFVINGAERVIVTQIIRSAGVYFSSEKDKKSGNVFFTGQVIPTRGAWIEFETSKKDVFYAKLDRSNRVPLTTFLRMMGLNSNREINELFGTSVQQENTKKVDESMGMDIAIKQVYEKLRPGENCGTTEGARSYIASRLFDQKRYDLASVGRFKVNKKLDLFARLIPLAGKIYYQGEEPLKYTGSNNRKVTLMKKGDLITKDKLSILKEHRDELLKKTFTYEQMLIGNSVVLETIKISFKEKIENPKYDIIPLLGNDQSEDAKHITVSDILASVCYYMRLPNGIGGIDDIDHLGNRRLRVIGELLQNQFRIGLAKLEKQAKDKMSILTESLNITPEKLINIRTLTTAIREFFGSSQLSQFMDQINPLSELTHKRRISALGAGGLTRDRAGFEVRDVHNSHYGRICPIETPEGQNIGLINSLATYARADRYGFIETPYFKVRQEKNKKPKILSDEPPVYLTADKEEEYYIAEANIAVNENGEIIDEVAIVRHANDTYQVNSTMINLIDVSPKQIVAVSTACIPFLEHDDANRALMGANMQRQAIPLLRPEAAFVATGIEAKAAHDSGVAVISESSGVVEYADSTKIIINSDNGELKTYYLNKYERSNHSTCVNQKPIVRAGERVEESDVLADGPSMDQGEMALGRNVVIAFMTWNGYNYEDAIIMNERLVQEDIYTSMHIEKYEVKVRDTKLGKEEITAELDNVAKTAVANLDEHGIVRVGSEVKEGDILVGKVTPKGQTDPTPEERLSQALFSDKSKDVKNTSKKVPHGGGGIVNRIEHFKRSEGARLEAGVNEFVRIFIVQKRKISEGDKMSGRHGNKGVISKILPQEDMPYLQDGTPIDIMLNPQGIPSRLNIGQVLEVHLGMAAKRLGIHIATPVFDGVTIKDLQEIIAEANMAEDGKEVVIDGRTGEPFDNRIVVGVMYMIKLAHMVDDKLHARDVGKYTLVTQQPMGGKAQNGGQRFGEMEVWALEAYGAAHVLREMLTIKSDDMIGRNEAYKAICNGEDMPEPGVPEAFRVFVKELQGLGLSIKLIDNETKENVANVSLVDRIVASVKEARGHNK